MANSNQNTVVNALDFDTIKANLTQYMRGQDQFKDYDFEGSGMNILLDLLSAHTHYNGFYHHMALNESFIDTAITRDGVISLAKLVGYTPRSRTAPKATVDVNFGTTRPTINSANFDYLPSGVVFRGTAERTNYNFITRKPYELLRNSSNEYIINGIEITEGSIKVTNYVVDQSNSDQRFLISSRNVDMSSVIVRVQRSIEDSTGFTDVWSKNTDFSSLSEDSLVYFTEETNDGYFRIYFGDGVLGRKPRHGNYVTVQYLTTDGPDANGLGRTDSTNSRTFRMNILPQATVSVVSPAAGGSLKEDIESIRYNAPRAYQTQDRAVTSEDYRVIVHQNYPNAESVFVYGGEDANPPVFGKVFIAVKPKEGTTLTDIEKRNLATNIVGVRNVLGITPEIIDPDALYLKVTTSIIYDPSLTDLADTGIENRVVAQINRFSNRELSKFDRGLVYSQFSTNIDDADVSIIGNQTTVRLEKRLELNLGQSISYELDFNNAFFHPEDNYSPILSSDSFTYLDGTSTATAFLDDDGSGNIRIYKLVDGSKSFINENAGTIDYTNGTINLVSFTPTGLSGQTSTISIEVQPANQNINAKRNTILFIDEADTDAVTVSATPRNVTTDFSSISGTPFPFEA